MAPLEQILFGVVFYMLLGLDRPIARTHVGHLIISSDNLQGILHLPFTFDPLADLAVTDSGRDKFL